MPGKCLVGSFSLGVALVLCLGCPCRADQPPKAGATAAEDERAYQELAQQVAELEKISRVFERVANLVSPAVVHIQSKKAASFMDKNFTVEETGSGVVVRLPGYDEPYLLTNNHVIERVEVEQLVITTHDRRLLRATKAWKDELSDVAVLAITEKNFATARLGDSDQVRVGHWVLAVGSPFDQSGSVSHGIVSGKGRRALKLGTGGIINQDFIQTDASINPGNSGGPLVNLRGEVIGINTAIASQSGGSEGVGFSIPANLVRRIATDLLQKGSVTRAYLGIRTVGQYPQLDPQIAAKLGLPNGRGGIVQEVFPDTPAATAGLEPLDVVLELDGQAIEDIDHLTHMVSLSPVGKEVSLLVWRNRQPTKLTTKLAARPKERGPPPGDSPNPMPVLAKWGIAVQELTDADRLRLDLGSQQGVLITQLSPHREVARLLEPFDVIEAIDGKTVTSAADLREIVRGRTAENGMQVRVARPSPQGIIRLDVTLKP